MTAPLLDIGDYSTPLRTVAWKALVDPDAERWRGAVPGVRVVAVDEAFESGIAALPAQYPPATAADDLAVFQYTSCTTRALPEAVKHSHRSVVTLMIGALYGVGLK